MNKINAHILELEQAFDEGIDKAIPVIINQVDQERRNIIIDKLNSLLLKHQYQGANKDYLNGIKEALDTVRGNND
jgi:hypothetical protein